MKRIILIALSVALFIAPAFAEERKIDKDALAVDLLKLRLTLTPLLYGVYNDLPEDPNGTTLVWEEFEAAGKELFDDELMPRVKMLVDGDWPVITDPIPIEPDPDVTEPEVPASSVIRIENTGQKMSWNGRPYDKFRFAMTGPEYTTKSFTIKFSDGNKLFIPNPKKMAMTGDNMKYQPGGVYSNNNPDIPTMEVYARRGTHPEWVEAHFQHPVVAGMLPPEETEPTPDPDPVLGDWTRITWADNGCRDPDPSFHRLCWTKIHGTTDKWWRKFALPTWMDDQSYAVDFRFSDGTKFYVADTRRMWMSADGPKYLKQVSNEPNKRHPKISEKYGTKATYVEFKVRR